MILLLSLLSLVAATLLIARMRDAVMASVFAGAGVLSLLYFDLGAVIVLIGSLSIVPVGLLSVDFSRGDARPVHPNFFLIEGGALIGVATAITIAGIFSRSAALHSGEAAFFSGPVLAGIDGLIGMVYFIGVGFILVYSARVRPFL